ncbi:hypothetical protein ACU8DI_14745 [Psychroserpens sp. BH13MA-6]
MKLKIGILLLFITFNCFAHKDKVIGETYGNVRVYMRTGFDYLDIDKIKIIGKLSEKLSSRLKFKDTIFIEYVQDYTDKYTDDLYMLEYNNSNYKIVDGIKSEYKNNSNNNGLSVRIYADRINIVDVLKLVEFTITNKEKTNYFLSKKPIGYNVEEDQELLDPLISTATDDNLLKKVIASDSEIINQLISEKILVKGQEQYGMEVYWKNNKFIFEYKHLHKNKQEFVFEVSDYLYHIFVNINDVLVFIDEKHFYYLDVSKKDKIEKTKLDMGTYYPIKVMSFGDKLLFQSPWNYKNINIFLIDKRKVISKFE